MIKNAIYRFRYKKSTKLDIGAMIIIILLIVAIIAFFPHFFRKTYTVTVTNKQIVKRNNIDICLIYTQTEDGKIKVFQNTNSFMELKFNSEDIYWAMGINRKYKVKVYGLDITPFPHYQNIINVKGIER